MRKYLYVVVVLAFVACGSNKRVFPTEEDMGGYVMVYHKDCDHGLHMAYSWDGYE